MSDAGSTLHSASREWQTAPVQVDILYFDGCPNHPATVELVRDVVHTLRLDATIREVEVRDVADAERLRFLGSPTVQVNGQDVDPEARSRADYAITCRVYGRSGSPPRELLEQAMQAWREEDRC